MIIKNPSLSENLNLCNRIVGLDRKVPLLDGRMVPYVYLDNAASTPPFLEVLETVKEFLPYYSSVHRGTGFKSRISTRAYDQAHKIIARFIGANPETNTVIFGKNATEAINKLSHRLPLAKKCMVLTTWMEHHSNDLPWRDHAEVIHVNITPEGRLDEEDFDRKLARYAHKISLVAVTGASNLTGFLLPIHRLARKAHEAGTRILVDAAQLAPHRRIEMKPDCDPEHLDFVVLSAHKMYAPFGTGALIGPRETFLSCGPDYCGGGTVDMVTEDEVYWSDLPDREEAGSPNVVGAVAMAAAAKVLMKTGFESIDRHEDSLVRYALEKLSEIDGITVHGEIDPERSSERVGVIPFNLDGIPHTLAAAIIGYEGGIGIRNGCFCAHPYILKLLKYTPEQINAGREKILSGDKSEYPGMVRMSFGCYNNTDDIDRLMNILKIISAGKYAGNYILDRSTGEYHPDGYSDSFADFFLLD